MRHSRFFVLATLLALLMPLLPSADVGALLSEERFPGWPQISHRPLTKIELGATEQRFAQGFPGKVAKFHNGREQFILRWVTTPTRQLHPAADCFRASGYSIEALPLCSAADPVSGRAQVSSCFIARKGPRELHVQERIWSSAGNDEYSDVSAWFWSATLRRSRGPWWVLTTIHDVERLAEAPRQ